jgi:hypothetical protein
MRVYEHSHYDFVHNDTVRSEMVIINLEQMTWEQDKRNPLEHHKRWNYCKDETSTPETERDIAVPLTYRW